MSIFDNFKDNIKILNEAAKEAIVASNVSNVAIQQNKLQGLQGTDKQKSSNDINV